MGGPLAAAVCWTLLFGACQDETGIGGSTSGTAGAGGCHDGPPEALFTIKVSQLNEEPLPPDTTVRVKWTAGEEPLFVLNDRESWKTLDDGSNVECQLDRDGPAPPSDLHELTCELWTNSATEVEVTAMGYLPLLETLQPMMLDGCEQPIPQIVELAIEIDTDAGQP